MELKRPPKVPPVGDRLPLTAEQNHRINEAFARVFGDSSDAKEVRTYLEALRLVVIPYELGPDALRHQEGMRDLVRIIETRIHLGRQQEPLHRRPRAEPGP